MASKLKLVAPKSFKAKVDIPLAGEGSEVVEMTFRHRTRAELEKFLEMKGEKDDAGNVLEMVEGWDLEDEFSKENVELLLENYLGASLAIFRVYIDGLTRARLGN